MDEQEFLSEAYADIKQKYERLQYLHIRTQVENNILKGIYQAIINNCTGDIKEFISESHNNLIERYAIRKASMILIVEENRLLKKKLIKRGPLKKDYLTGETP